MHEGKMWRIEFFTGLFLIQEADPQSQPAVIIVFAIFFCSYVHPHFLKQNKFQTKTMFTTGETVGLSERIIDDIVYAGCTWYLQAIHLLWSYEWYDSN